MVKDLLLVSDASATEPVTVAELKAYLQLEGVANDVSLQYTISGVRKQIEQRLNVSLISQTAEAVMELCHSKPYYLPYQPVGEVVSVQYEGENYLDFEVLYNSRKAIKVEQSGTFTITYELQPTNHQDIIHAVLLQAAHLWTHRDNASVSGWDKVAEMIITSNMLYY